eukprot:UN02175
MVCSQKRQCIFAGCNDGHIVVWTVDGEIEFLLENNQQVHSLLLGLNEEFLFASGEIYGKDGEKLTCMWDIDSEEVLCTFPHGQNTLKCQTTALAEKGKTILVWRG